MIFSFFFCNLVANRGGLGTCSRVFFVGCNEALSARTGEALDRQGRKESARSLGARHKSAARRTPTVHESRVAWGKCTRLRAGATRRNTRLTRNSSRAGAHAGAYWRLAVNSLVDDSGVIDGVESFDRKAHNARQRDGVFALRGGCGRRQAAVFVGSVTRCRVASTRRRSQTQR
jgi:hypothetical protein